MTLELITIRRWYASFAPILLVFSVYLLAFGIPSLLELYPMSPRGRYTERTGIPAQMEYGILGYLAVALLWLGMKVGQIQKHRKNINKARP